jgi:hypothetical protein
VSHTRHWLAVGCVAAALLGVAWLAGRVSATVVIAKDFAALCDEADLVFVGTVTGVASRWSDPATQSIETLVTFGDLTWLRGTVQTTVTLRFGGGEMDGLREEFAGVPQFSVGERRVIFAHEGTFVSPIVGFDQGALRVVAGTDGAVVLGAESAPSARGALRFGAPAQAKTTPVPLEVFLDRVRQQLTSPVGATP